MESFNVETLIEVEKKEEDISEVKIEANMTKCKICGEMKMRIQDGFYPSKNKKWVDITGRQWCGKKCADCNAKRAREFMQKNRKEENI